MASIADARCPHCGGIFETFSPDGDICRNGHTIPREQVRAQAKESSTGGSQPQRPEPEPTTPARFRFRPLNELLAEPPEQISYLVDGLLITAGVSLIAAKPKVGKSTLVRNLVRAAATGTPFLGRQCRSGSVLYLALEEHRGRAVQHFRDLGGETNEPVYVHVGSAPEQAIEALRDAIAQHRPVLVIIDPLLKLVRVRDTNDYAEVSRSMEPVIELARGSGAHLLLVHHLGKGERTGGDGILGSTALFGAVDTALLYRRREDNRRTLSSIQRYGDDLPETVVTMNPNTGAIAVAGDVAVMELASRKDAVLDVIGDETLTEPDIRQRIGGNTGLTSRALRDLVHEGSVSRGGEGRRGSPYTYHIADDSRVSRFRHREQGAKRENGDPDSCPECGRPLEQGGCWRCDRSEEVIA